MKSTLEVEVDVDGDVDDDDDDDNDGGGCSRPLATRRTSTCGAERI